MSAPRRASQAASITLTVDRSSPKPTGERDAFSGTRVIHGTSTAFRWRQHWRSEQPLRAHPQLPARESLTSSG
jgi:hypothetical protein